MLNTINNDNFLSPEDLAQKFKISLSSVYKLVRSGEIPSIRLGKIYRIPESSLSHYLRHQQQKRFSPKQIPSTVSTFLNLLRTSPTLKNKICEIYLYGSYARGDYDEDSDIDLCVVVSGVNLRLQMNINSLVEKAMAESQYQELLSVRIESLESWEQMQQNNYPLVQNILHEGVPLWKNH